MFNDVLGLAEMTAAMRATGQVETCEICGAEYQEAMPLCAACDWNRTMADLEKQMGTDDQE